MKILVIGEVCEDLFIYGSVERLSPEAPIPIIKPNYFVKNKGMAGNVFSNLKEFGVDVSIVSNDGNIKKTRYVDESYNYILLRIDDETEINSLNILNLPNEHFDGIVISDYNKGFLSSFDIQKICEKYDCPVFLDTKKELGSWSKYLTFIKINHQEYQKNKKFLKDNTIVLSKTIITKGKYGCEFQGKNYSTKEVEVKDVVGAGDTFLAGLVFKYIQTQDIETAIEFANKCSTNVVQKRGVAVVNPNELDNE